MGASVDAICETLERKQIMPADEVAALRKRWFRPGREGVADPDRFRQWLVSNNFVTEFQAGLLIHDEAELLTLNQYKLVDRVPRGRFAGMYKALDEAGKLYFVQILPPAHAADPALLTQFKKESQQGVTLYHPNVVRILDKGEASGRHFVVQEYLEGECLDELIQRRGSLPALQTTRIIAHALQGMQYLHEQGLVHGHVKLDSVILANPLTRERRGTPKVVKLLDALLRRSLFEDKDPLRGAGAIGLVPIDGEETLPAELIPYAAPERRGPRGSADARSDVFSLGCVFYHCLAGESPFGPAGARANAKVRPLGQAAPDTPEMLQQIVEQMIALDPAERYQTAARAAKALRVFLASEEEAQAKAAEDAGPEAVRSPVAPRQEVPQEEDAEPIRREDVEAIWDQLRPSDREIAFMSAGAALVFVFGGIMSLLLGHTFWNLLFFVFGAIASPVAERVLIWVRRNRAREVREW